MKQIKTKVVHSQSKAAWNVIGDELGGQFKIARVPYVVVNDEKIDELNRSRAFEHAIFISQCFTNYDIIINSRTK